MGRLEIMQKPLKCSSEIIGVAPLENSFNSLYGNCSPSKMDYLESSSNYYYYYYLFFNHFFVFKFSNWRYFLEKIMILGLTETF